VPVVSREVILPPHRFWETRAGSGSPIVLIHGLGGSSDWWRHNFNALAESHTVAAVDLVGFGRNRFFIRRSSLPPPLDEVATLLARWIESSFDGAVHLVGNSMGGQIAIHLAASRPDLVRSLTLVNSTGIPITIEPSAHIENIVVPRGAISFARVVARDAFRAGPTSFVLAFSRLLLDDARPLLASLKMPVLLLWGERDPLVPLSYAQRIREAVPHARLVVVPDAGHVPMWENPTRFNAELLAFIDEVDAVLPPTAHRGAFAWAISGFRRGMMFRQAGARRDVVLIHGLGMSSAYFVRLARALFDRGASPIAPDFPGFGESPNAKAMSPSEQALLLASWADDLSIANATWVGHSTGCNAVAHLAALRPDLVRDAVYIGPLWSRARHPHIRFASRLFLDAFREPLALAPFVMRAYLRCGLARWLATWRLCARDLRDRPQSGTFIAGSRDPIPDRDFVKVIDVPGAHACHFFDSVASADHIMAFATPAATPRESTPPGSSPV
jgi:pimeloyl-ACP methyl ester carboxylesterase